MLPIHAVLSPLRDALAEHAAAVLRAPPGAGKTTVVPVSLRDEPWLENQRIVMLEPRRLAARAAAWRMARQLGEQPGETIGYRVRRDTRVGPRTRVEVVTEGVLTRILHSDPTLEGYGLVIFDEFHERSIHADVGLALTLQTQRLVRPSLRILTMSATLDTEPLARLLGSATPAGAAPVVTSEGRTFPVETRYLPRAPETPLHIAVARAIREAARAGEGDILAFLPGVREIHAVARLLAAEPVAPRTYVVELHGTMPLEEQDRAIAPASPGERKIVLATSIAETSLTIEGVRTVVDSGLSRVARFSARTGMSRLETVRVSRASADQRRGRAGRVAAGLCFRLWHEHETPTLLPFNTPEILEADLAPLALDLAAAGVRDISELSWITEPPAATLAQAHELLRELEAIDADKRLTPHGADILRLGTHPRLAHMMLRAAEHDYSALAADLAALLTERDLIRGGEGPPPSDLYLRVEMLRSRTAGPAAPFAADRGAVERVRTEAAAYHRTLGEALVSRSRASRGREPSKPNDTAGPHEAIGELVALAYPDRVAIRRSGAVPRFVMRDGGGASLPPHDPLAHEPFLAIAETDGRLPESRVLRAASLTEASVRRLFATQIATRDLVYWDPSAGEVRALRRETLGGIVLREAPISNPDPEAVRAALRGAIAAEGLAVLPWSESATQLRARLAFLHHHDPSWPDISDHALLATLDKWLGPQLERVRRRGDLSRIDVRKALEEHLSWQQRAHLDQLAPTHVEVPSGSRLPIDYSQPETPALAVRLQEMFGCTETPRILQGRVSLTLHLLSPAHRPIQVTRDLAGFWRSSYFDVRKDLRGRYPKHPWPDDPLTAEPTRRTKPR